MFDRFESRVQKTRTQDFTTGFRIWSLAILSFAAVGCSESLIPATDPIDSRGGATAQRLSTTDDQQKVIAAATDALRVHFDAVRARPAASVVEAGPTMYTQRGGTERISDRTLPQNNQMRRMGRIWVTDEKGTIVAHCQIKVQRLDTSDYRALRSQDEFNDLPTSTPIDSDAGLTAEQRQVWTDQPRDSNLEREILGILMRRLRGETVDPPSKASSETE